MKIIKLLFPVLLIIMLSCNSNNTLELEKSVYSKAISVNDYTTALGAANRIVLINPEEKFFNDSIANILFLMGNNEGALKTAKEVLKDHSNENIYNVLARSSSNLGKFEEATKYYQELVKIDTANQFFYYYEIGSNYYNLNKMDSAFSFMKKVMAEPKSMKQRKTFVTNNKNDETFYYVAALNTIGVIYLNLKKYDQAEEVFKTVNTLDPKFQLGKNNYQILQSVLKKQ